MLEKQNESLYVNSKLGETNLYQNLTQKIIQ